MLPPGAGSALSRSLPPGPGWRAMFGDPSPRARIAGAQRRVEPPFAFFLADFFFGWTAVTSVRGDWAPAHASVCATRARYSCVLVGLKREV